MDQRDRLLRALPTVFPPYVPTTPVAPHECEECWGLRAELDGHTWQDLPLSVAADGEAILPLLTPEARHALLPIWLKAGLLEPDGEAATMLIIHLQMYGPWEAVTREQAAFVLGCVEHIAASSDWLIDQEGREMIESLERAWSKAAA